MLIVLAATLVLSMVFEIYIKKLLF